MKQQRREQTVAFRRLKFTFARERRNPIGLDMDPNREILGLTSSSFPRFCGCARGGDPGALRTRVPDYDTIRVYRRPALAAVQYPRCIRTLRTSACPEGPSL